MVEKPLADPETGNDQSRVDTTRLYTRICPRVDWLGRSGMYDNRSDLMIWRIR
jgi:hypothetical protein